MSTILCFLTLFLFTLLSSTFDNSSFKPKTPPISAGSFINSGTPSGAPLSFDCAVREYAYEYGKQMAPKQGSFVELFDALQLQACNITRPKPLEKRYIPKFNPKSVSGNNSCVFYVDPKNGNDSNNGTSVNNAFLTIEKAVLKTRNTRQNNENCMINLLEGIFYIKDTIFLTPNDSYLTIQNYNGENVILSGGIELEFEDEWKLEKYSPISWKKFSGYNNVYARASVNKSNDLVKLSPKTTCNGISQLSKKCEFAYIGSFKSYEDCQNAVISSLDNPLYSFTWFNSFSGAYTYGCYGVRDISWQAVLDDNVYSGRLSGSNIWSRKVKNFNDLFDNKINGLRINNIRSIRARYPDQNPETSMQYDPLSGWMTYPTKWRGPVNAKAVDIIQNATNWPDVIWPMKGPGNTTSVGMGDWGNYQIGVGGPCVTDEFGIDPPYGYWCSPDAPRGIEQHQSPTGIYLNLTVGLNLPYSNGGSEAEIHTWRPGHWYTFIFNTSTGYSINTGLLQFDKGGNQGGEGHTEGEEWYIENVFEELTMPNEYYYNRSTNTLYYYYNSSFEEPPPENTYFVATRNKVLFNISGNYRQQNGPIIKNITIRGVTIRDTERVYLDIHGLPSGGDWAVVKKGAVYVQGSENVTLDDLYMTRLDGNGVFIYGYNRGLAISNSYFEWLGESAMVSWGYTEGIEDKVPGMGPDGRPGNQPRHTTIINNIARELGIYQKQSSMWFQAQTCQTLFMNNIFFNGPRAGINTNDGFGQDNWFVNNLMVNMCRESGDHGVWNSWDRVPYITRVGNGSSSIIPNWNNLLYNFFIGTYSVSIVVDTDDGSSYYKTHDNFLVYGFSAQKSNFGGHDNRDYNNIYAYVDGYLFGQSCWGPYYSKCIASAYDWFTRNKAIFMQNEYYTSNCNPPNSAYKMIISNNSVYIPNPSTYTVCNMNFSQWQAQGNDPGTTINPWPEDSEVIQWAKQMLGH